MRRLRYFNAAGADPDGRYGEDHRPETHLVPLVIDAALGRRPELEVYGNDYPTPDGTCLRDYVHVTDLADAHLLALDRLERGSITVNLGNGTGHSVLAGDRRGRARVGRARCRTASARAARAIRPCWWRRPERARRELGWRPRFADLDEIVRTALRWREAHPNGYAD